MELSEKPCTRVSELYRFKEQKHKQEKLFQRFFSIYHDIDKTIRWIVLADKILWVEIGERYCYLFMQGGKPAFSIRVALGLLFIKEKLNITDEETVAQITENPYLQ
jgi:IS5 family transposase